MVIRKTVFVPMGFGLALLVCLVPAVLSVIVCIHSFDEMSSSLLGKLLVGQGVMVAMLTVYIATCVGVDSEVSIVDYDDDDDDYDDDDDDDSDYDDFEEEEDEDPDDWDYEDDEDDDEEDAKAELEPLSACGHSKWRM